ncbi:MAG: holo-ACP synthase [Aerococcus sp.]|nr:holo-ACP synthase [Aerococcus sp.]
MAIIGIGIDLVEIDRIKDARMNPRFIEKLLTSSEQTDYDQLTSEKRQLEFLAGRWASKEAYAKAYGVGIYGGSPLSFHEMVVKTTALGQPHMAGLNPGEVVHLSISHTDHYAMANVIVESRTDES